MCARFRRHEKFFPEDITWSRLSRLLAKGATIKATRLNENFGWLEYLEKNSGVVPFFARNEEGKTIAINGKATPALPYTLIALVQTDKSLASRR
ncbi:sodium/hydrogen exchanger family protein [Buttiauxella brennerae ATCC 51605]|uniref:Sodium/hydrogen exchanger family protein n=1 Tax=Buttiauxella brennerae ATCC 51605 TaxID=1354251 RepID=A0A1B7IET2_9ENTR|nr:sodium/hydrogen exchanger family protein [Buttiauxella brennerae ATCC 51605]